MTSAELSTAVVRGELCTVNVSRVCCRRAEAAALVRVAGSAAGKELRVGCSARAVADRLACCLVEVFGTRGVRVEQVADEWRVLVPSGASTAVQAGLVSGAGTPTVGLPPFLVMASACDRVAALRGTFLGVGRVVASGRGASVGFEPVLEPLALGLVWLARQRGVRLRSRSAPAGSARLELTDIEGASAWLRLMGAPDSAELWREHRRTVAELPREVSGLGEANQIRSVTAAVAAAAAVERVLDLLGDRVPAHLREAAELRLAHREASLEQLGRLADPPLSKDAIAGRLRRLLAMADSVDVDAAG